ncbi:general substrate transporter [Dipodascopsis tothii]|uniref:general substrate transporter n=1 Tax=Dipodascopsis tothii TaxID=44089 RepID=UPI0034CEA51D
MPTKTYNPYVVAASSTIGGMLFGMDVSSVAAFVDNETYRAYFNYPNDVQQGMITAVMAVGSFFGSITSGKFSDKMGRKRVIQIGAIIWVVGALVQCSVTGVRQLMLGRFIGGLSIGICSSQVPVYIAELSPKRIRGRLVGLFQWSITWGITIMFFISYACTFMEGPKSFRTAWGIQAIPGVALYFALAGFPESPRWLASKDRWDEAVEIIAGIQGHGDIENDAVTVEVQEIREAVEIERMSQDVTVLSLFEAKTRFRTLTGLSAMVWQQLTGINVMMYYVVYTFAMAGYSGNANLISSAIQYVVNVVFTVPALFHIDDWGRRPLLISGAVVMAVFMFLVGAIMGAAGHYVDSVGGNTEIKWAVPDRFAANSIILCNYVFVAAFSPTWGPGAWVYVSEIFPLKQRATANGLCVSCNWIFTSMFAFFVPVLFKKIQWRTYIVFSVFLVAMAFHVYFLFPETKGKTLEEIDLIWEDEIPPWRTGSDSDVFKQHERLLERRRKRAAGPEASESDTSGATSTFVDSTADTSADSITSVPSQRGRASDPLLAAEAEAEQDLL